MALTGLGSEFQQALPAHPKAPAEPLFGSRGVPPPPRGELTAPASSTTGPKLQPPSPQLSSISSSTCPSAAGAHPLPLCN